jgi:hypothetical protein
MVPTKTSRAANEVSKAMPIFQSKPIGLITGSINLPNSPAYDACSFSVFYCVARSSSV